MPAPDESWAARIAAERRRLKEAHDELCAGVRRLHAQTDRLHGTAERLHDTVHRCEDTLHAGEEMIANRPRRSPPGAQPPPETSSISRMAP